MKNRNKVLSALLAGALVLSTAACGAQAPSDNQPADTQTSESAPADTAEATQEEPVAAGSDAPLVIAEDDFSEKFSEFFCASVPDQRVADMTAVSLLENDRAGELIYNGIEGETKSYNGTDYTYEGISDCVVTENADGTVDYDFKLREGVKFSDGEELTADDVIFSYYVFLDPSYDGSGSTYALPIKGLEAYRSGSDTLFNLLLKGGAENTDFTFFTEEQQKQFFEKDLPDAGAKFAQSIADYCTSKGYLAENEAVAKDSIANGMANWGFAKDNGDGTITTTATGTDFDVAGGKAPTAEDFFNEMLAAYDNDVATLSSTEKADNEVLDYLPDDYRVAISTGDSVDYVEGIQKVNDYEVKVTLTEVDATAIYQLAIMVQPMHYYGDASKYDYDAHKFGFEKGDLSSVRAKTTTPMGAGPYKFEKFENKIVYLTANENYWRGVPVTKNLQFKVTSNADKESGVVQGTIDISDPSASKSALEQIAGENSNGELSGDKLTTVLTDYRGYGYIGMNSQNVCVGGENGSEASKNLRKAIATVISVYRDVTIDSYYGEAASVINYPISNTSWAAPQASDPDYKVAFSVDVDGNDIYTAGMSEDEKYAAALQAALGYFEAAGYTVKDGKLTAAPSGAKMGYEIMIGGGGSGDHPSFGILTAASEALKTIGFDLTINDLSDTSIMWNALEAGTAELWCAAWQTTLDPDMFQIYHSEGGSAGHYRIYSDDLDKLVLEARTVTDQAVRKALYKEALDYVVDFACEIPVYQRQDCTIYSTERVNVDSITPDQTTYYTFMNEIHKIAMN
ncbi:ABC transporter substrate-binding protein [Butyrivibrio sp. CB08]|uniref:ABC transporter substrate-binding protein n=1 Tax=Butyrivibrio sp. CB08 TaxID=2364879 RepID=UPI000EAA906D|nr:ABC transporter substrate-binding protein [Butyrivibrio sp. CB08]RKM62176.1 ABC transporter substrate-binding protein [Butyrivibrio sp. CB08]